MDKFGYKVFDKSNIIAAGVVVAESRQEADAKVWRTFGPAKDGRGHITICERYQITDEQRQGMMVA